MTFRTVDFLIPFPLHAMTERIKREFYVERHEVTHVVLYEVTGEDLEQLEKETLTVGEDFSFALAALSVAVTVSITLATVDIPAGKTHDVFWVVLLVTYLAAFFFGIRWLRGRRQFKSIVKKIRERGGALGEEGREADLGGATTVVTTVSGVQVTTKAD